MDKDALGMILEAEEKAIEMRAQVDQLIRNKADLAGPLLYNYVGTLKVNLEVLRNRINTLLEVA